MDKAQSISNVFDQDPALRDLLVIYFNSASLRCQVNGLTDNMLVRRKTGEFEMIMRKEHKDFGPVAPPQFTNVYYQNYSGAEAALFTRGKAMPAARALVVDQGQTLTRAKPDCVKLTKGLLTNKELGPKLAAWVPK